MSEYGHIVSDNRHLRTNARAHTRSKYRTSSKNHARSRISKNWASGVWCGNTSVVMLQHHRYNRCYNINRMRMILIYMDMGTGGDTPLCYGNALHLKFF